MNSFKGVRTFQIELEFGNVGFFPPPKLGKSALGTRLLVFEERGKAEYPEENLSEQRREPTTNSTHIWLRRRERNPGHIGRRRALSPLSAAPPLLRVC